MTLTVPPRPYNGRCPRGAETPGGVDDPGKGTDVTERSEDGRLTCRYRYRLRVTPTQAKQLQAIFNTNRMVWNTALGRWNDLWEHEGLHFFQKEMCAELTDWRQTYDWLAAQPAQCQQQVLADLSRSISCFFNPNTKAGRPRFKRKDECASARWTQSFALVGGRLHVAVAGGRIALRVVWSRPLPSVPKSVSVMRDAGGRWWASFVVRITPDAVGETGQITGLDLGLTTYATTEFAEADVPNPRLGRAAAKALARSQRNLCRKKVGSVGRAKARRHTARVHARIANQRRDFHQKEARKLARRFDLIGVEALGVQRMTSGGGRYKSGLNRSLSDAGWGLFVTALEWQAKKAGHEVVRRHARNTTQNCSDCGTKAKSPLGLKQRTFECSECGLVLDRDRNAARNLNPGWAVPGAPADGSKTPGRARPGAARGTESLAGEPSSSQVLTGALAKGRR